MRIFRSAALVGLTVLAAAACSRNVAKVEGTLAGAPEKEVVVKLLDMNTYTPLDTLKTDAAGKFSCKVDVEPQQPEFVYLFYKDTKVASLLLNAGDDVKVSTDTLGNCSVEGSPESQKLLGVEKDFHDFATQMAAGTTSSELSKLYIAYYRKCVKYILENSGSLTCIPVLYQNLNPDFPIFSQTTDALHFRNVTDTLSKLYPDSKYVRALAKETERREQILNFNTRVSTAEELGFPDFTLPDINGNKVRLGDVDAKVVIVYFWTATDAAQKLFNTDVLKPLYNDYHKKGLEIVAVAPDADKSLWASVVKNQGLEWINLCDNSGTAVTLYNVSQLPASFMIVDGEIMTRPISGEKALRQELDKILR